MVSLNRPEKDSYRRRGTVTTRIPKKHIVSSFMTEKVLFVNNQLVVGTPRGLGFMYVVEPLTFWI